MLNVEKLSFAYPTKELYHKVSFSVEEGEHAVFIGTSGSGKSTLIDLIQNKDHYIYDGKITLNGNTRIGYVSQFLEEHPEETTVFNFIAAEFINYQKQIEDVCEEMATTSDLDEVLERYQDLLDAYDAIGGDDYESLIIKQLNLAGLSSFKNSRIKDLSGGEFKLVQVMKEMMSQPELLIMDEPDAFLDFENLNALMDLINNHKGSLLVITHNRYLLNHCFNKILHLEDKEIQEFSGTYIEYNYSLLAKKIEIQELAMADDEKVAKNDELIEKLRYIATNNSEPSKGRALKARVKIQERLLKSRIKAPFVDVFVPEIELNSKESHEEVFLKIEGLNIAFEESLLEDVSFVVGPNEKVALIGPNGTGKTSLFRAIVKNDRPEIYVNDSIEFAYLSQVQGETINEATTVRNEFLEAGFETYQEIEEHIANYGFDSKILDHQIESLSGGEKNMLQLAKIAKKETDLLLLDEPSSHLDTYSQIALDQALSNYQGSILMISHDYYTIVNTMDYVLIIEDKGIRKMKMKKFKRMVHANHFRKDYLELEDQKKSIEVKIESALKNKNFELAQEYMVELDEVISGLIS